VSPAVREITVTGGDGTFQVEVHASGRATTHVVTVPVGMAQALGWESAGDEQLVRASFEFLLEREPPSSILRRFSLDVIGDYFPEFTSEMARRP
jgi:hypothetical protein